MSESDTATSESLTPPYMVILGCGTSTGVPVIWLQVSRLHIGRSAQSTHAHGVAVTEAGNFLIDTPPNCACSLFASKSTRPKPSLYTHAHVDHVLGLDDLRVFGYRKKASLPLYCEPAVQDHLRRMFAYAFDEETETLHSRPKIHLEDLSEKAFSLLGLMIQPILLMHGQTRVLSFRIGDVAFCTDCNAIPPEREPLLEGLDVLMIDAVARTVAPDALQYSGSDRSDSAFEGPPGVSHALVASRRLRKDGFETSSRHRTRLRRTEDRHRLEAVANPRGRGGPAELESL